MNFIRNKYQLKKYKSIIPDIDNLFNQSYTKINVPDALKYILCGVDINLNIQINIPNRNEYLVITLFEYSLRKYIEIKEEHDRELGINPKVVYYFGVVNFKWCKVSQHIKRFAKGRFGVD